jgi:GDP-L-fucose synthase
MPNRVRALITGITGQDGSYLAEGRLVWDASYPDGQPRRKLNVDRAQREFGFVADIGLEEGLKRTVDWYEASIRSAVPL